MTNRWMVEFKNFQGIHVPSGREFRTQQQAVQFATTARRPLDTGRPHVWRMPL